MGARLVGGLRFRLLPCRSLPLASRFPLLVVFLSNRVLIGSGRCLSELLRRGMLDFLALLLVLWQFRLHPLRL